VAPDYFILKDLTKEIDSMLLLQMSSSAQKTCRQNVTAMGQTLMLMYLEPAGKSKVDLICCY
jgi:hypothetical protein